MRLTFEANSLKEIFEQIKNTLAGTASYKPPSPEGSTSPVALEAEVFAEGPNAYVIVSPPSKPENTSKPKLSKQDIAAKMAKLRAARTAKAELRKAAEEKPVYKSVEKPVEEPVLEPVEKLEPVDLVALRTKTLAELQSAYANGKDQEVLELLSRFGNGAKTFRELKPDMFVPIREAIDLGALT